MRYLSLIFFIFLSFHSYFVFSEESPSSGGYPQPTINGECSAVCSGKNQNCGSYASNNPQSFFPPGAHSFADKEAGYLCGIPPSCPPPTSFNLGVCDCPSPQYWNVVSQSCSDPDPEEPENCPSGYPPVNGQCPVCPTGFNPDGTCKDESASSAASSDNASSTPTSSPNSAAASSVANSTSGGDDGDDGNDGGGGGGNNNGGSNGGGGSASSAGSSSGSNSSWTPTSGFGNWIPVNPGSNCPNKYQDINGQWWCWGGDQPGTSSSGSNGSASSGSNNSASSSLGYSGSDGCESEPVCPSDQPACLQLLEQWQLRCGGVDEFDDKLFELEQGTDGEGEPVTFSSSLTSFKEELEQLPNVVAITQFFSFNASGSCPTWQVSVWVFDITIDQLCSDLIPWDIIAGIMIAVACLIAARVALT